MDLFTFYEDENPSIQTRFHRFHERNPKVYKLFQLYARQARDAGCTRYSADAILHRIRWHLTVETQDGGGFQINNNFTSRYARLLIRDDPTFAGFFEIRRLQA